MKIQKLTLEGFRGFRKKTEFELHPNVNVFVGVNGSGKTSVLDAVGMLLNDFMLKILRGKPNGDTHLYLSEPDLNISSEKCKVEISFKSSNSTVYNIELEYDNTKNYPWGIEYSGKDWLKYFNTILENKNTSIPLIRYFKINKLIPQLNKDVAFIPNEVSDERIKIYKTAFNLNTDFETFSKWYINEENDENRVKVETKDLEYSNPKLKPVREAINNFFNKIEASSLSNLIGDVRGTNGKLSPLAIKKNGTKLNINQLSSGEKQVILYVADIASRLSIANPKLENTNEGEGVVLIDEIDTHLHPAWQRDIIPALTHVFPNVQFLVTTHSPQVLSNVKKECVHIIEDFKRVAFTPSIYGADSNMILWDVFGVKKRPKHADERFREYYKTLETEDRDTALKLLKGLQESFGENRLDVQKAKTSFEFEYDEYLPEA